MEIKTAEETKEIIDFVKELHPKALSSKKSIQPTWIDINIFTSFSYKVIIPSFTLNFINTLKMVKFLKTVSVNIYGFNSPIKIVTCLS